MTDHPDSPPEAPIPPQTPEPYPRMIIVCMVITATLLVVIMGVLALDYTQRSRQKVQNMPPPGFFLDPATTEEPQPPANPEP